LASWERELLRIVRKIAQYFYPQMQTQVMNEGWATFTHFHIMTRLMEDGYLTHGSYQEFLRDHTNVVMQRPQTALNPYYLGFEMFRDIKRICLEPTAEDKAWFDFAGNPDWVSVCNDAVRNYRDESFILQFLSPHLIRKLKLFAVHDTRAASFYRVDAIHDDAGYKKIRKTLSEQYLIGAKIPDLSIVDCDIMGDRTLKLHYEPFRDQHLNKEMGLKVLGHMRALWGFEVEIHNYDGDGYSSVLSSKDL